MGLLHNLLVVAITVVLIEEGYWWCDGCLERERVALLELKHSLNFPNGKALPSWGKHANCCDWEAVGCHATTQRVTKIDFWVTRDRYLGDWRLNASLFLPFEELYTLSMVANRIVGCLDTEGFEKLSGLHNLEVLYLDGNKFNNSILSSLAGLSSLRDLSLESNELKGIINIEELNNLTRLEFLYMDDNEIEGFKSFRGGHEDLLRLRNLEELYLDHNRFDNKILPFLRGLSSLKYLGLEGNQLKGSLNMTELEALSNLSWLDIGGNEIDKFVFSKDVRGFGNLRELLVSNITTNGRSVPFSLLQSVGAFPNLKSLDLSMNNIEGTEFAQALPYLENLEGLYMSDSVVDPSVLQTIERILFLRTLNLENCRLNGTTTILQGLCKLKHLEELDVSDNGISGALPWCLTNLTALRVLDISSNHFVGDISLSPLPSLSSITDLILSGNQFQIPVSLNPFFNHSKLKHFDGRNNEILYAEVGEQHLAPRFQLDKFYLSCNGYCGGFPKFLFYQYNLSTVYFSNCKMRGGFPNWLLENNTQLSFMYLVNSSLSGCFQLPMYPHVSLTHLDISSNYFQGHIPTKIGAYLPSLEILSMSSNSFNGSIPSSLGIMPSLEVLDFSENNLSGSIPSFSSSWSLRQLFLAKNRLEGSLESVVLSTYYLMILDLTHNCFTGGIPKWIGDLPFLGYLLLGYNHFDGRIPLQLCKLHKLSLINLSHNNFSGHILPCLGFGSYSQHSKPFGYIGDVLQEPLDIVTKGFSYSYTASVLSYFSGMDLSCNNLTGEIPPEIGNLNQIQSLNLSHNNLIGQIPQTFSNLSQVESLDLSHNNLNGEIPPQLTELHALAVFSVAYNNLSGKTPEMVGQFSTFNQSSYEGNRLLHGLPLPRSSTEEEPPTSSPGTSSDDKDDEDSGFIDMRAFDVTFSVSYIIVLLAIATVLYINPHWRRAWFYFVERIIDDWYYFLLDNLPVPSSFRSLKRWLFEWF